jgi:hypothetical protein
MSFFDIIKDTLSSPVGLYYIIFYLILFALILVLPFFLYNISRGVNTDSKYYYLLYITLLSIIIVISGLLFMKSQMYKKTFFGLLILCITVIGILCFLTNIYFNGKVSNTSTNIILGITLGFIVFVALALFYKVFANTLENQSGIISFIIQFIFFIPCFINDVVESALNQYRNTPSSVFVLFILEIILLICYCLIPIITGAVLNTNGKNLLANAVFLNNKQTIATGQDLTYLENNDSTTGKNTKIALSSYSISMWIYINQNTHQLEKGSYKNIFSYIDNGNTEAKPQIIYYNDMDNTKKIKNIYKIIFEGSINSKNTSYQIDLPGQKWNHLVFNYRNSASVELYLNGVLERNFQMKYKPVYSLGDIIVIGDKNGLDGSICNITYYNQPQTKFQIANIYNIYMSRNPPTPID